MELFNFLKEIELNGFIDILFMWLIIYSVLIWFKKTKAAFVLTGIIIMAGVYLIAREFDLTLTASVLQGFFAVILIVIVVIFQEELRHFFEKIAVWSLNRKSQRPMQLSRPEVETLVRALNDFAHEKIGALIVIQGKDLIMRHLEGGVELHGKLSEALLKSIFDPHSSGHDGAVVIERDQVSRFSCQLPLSKDFKTLGQAGTRHAAALGLSELTDALCLVVSEERGTIVIARNGALQTVNDSETLSTIIKKFYQEINPPPANKFWQDFFKKNSREKIIALVMTLALWFVLVYGSKLVYKTYTVPIECSALPAGLIVEEITPQTIEVSFSGPRRAFYFFNTNEVKVFLKLWNVKEGRHSFKIAKSYLSFPQGIALENLEPSVVKVKIADLASIKKKESSP
ncbi:MAG TPA: diadenylate cyclase [Thermodesulfobacteriota bacterium]|nr:diadenylate cyclase [Thermodesulfobacteriota bacterium]